MTHVLVRATRRTGAVNAEILRKRRAARAGKARGEVETGIHGAAAALC